MVVVVEMLGIPWVVVVAVVVTVTGIEWYDAAAAAGERLEEVVVELGMKSNEIQPRIVSRPITRVIETSSLEKSLVAALCHGVVPT